MKENNIQKPNTNPTIKYNKIQKSAINIVKYLRNDNE